ncbi:hypothetical protein C0J52_02904, partial [Blattella germanica]
AREDLVQQQSWRCQGPGTLIGPQAIQRLRLIYLYAILYLTLKLLQDYFKQERKNRGLLIFTFRNSYQTSIREHFQEAKLLNVIDLSVRLSVRPTFFWNFDMAISDYDKA